MVKSHSNKLEQGILKTVEYFHLFKYSPSEREIHTYSPIKVSKNRFSEALGSLEGKKRLVSLELHDKADDKVKIYALQGHDMLLGLRVVKKAQTENKTKKISGFVALLSRFPAIQLIGLSGSCAMNNAQQDDDIDIFIISSKGTIWTVRMLCIICAEAMRLRRRRGSKTKKDKICMNLFFDESALGVKKSKQNLYTAHEVVQMRPLYMRVGVYERYLDNNRWVGEYFPNLKIARQNKTKRNLSTPGFLTKHIEVALKSLQLRIMRPHITNELISDTQLWFFPDDHEKKVRSKMQI